MTCFWVQQLWTVPFVLDVRQMGDEYVHGDRHEVGRTDSISARAQGSDGRTLATSPGVSWNAPYKFQDCDYSLVIF